MEAWWNSARLLTPDVVGNTKCTTEHSVQMGNTTHFCDFTLLNVLFKWTSSEKCDPLTRLKRVQKKWLQVSSCLFQDWNIIFSVQWVGKLLIWELLVVNEFANLFIERIQLKGILYVLEMRRLTKSNRFPQLLCISVALIVWPLTIHVWLMMKFPPEKHWRKQILSDFPSHTNTLIHMCTCTEASSPHSSYVSPSFN